MKIVCPHCSQHISHDTTEERFWNQVDKSGECWEWIGTTNDRGYGLFRYNYGDYRAHRFSYELAHGPIIEEGMFVCHKCDNPLCVRPDHLFLGTTQENTTDKVSKGRQARGETSGNSILTEEQVRSMIQEYIPGRFGYRVLAQKYGVSAGHVARIIKGKLWKHIRRPYASAIDTPMTSPVG